MSMVLCNDRSKPIENSPPSDLSGGVEHFLSLFPAAEKATARALIKKVEEHLSVTNMLVDLCRLCRMSEQYNQSISLEPCGDVIEVKIMGGVVTEFGGAGLETLLRSTECGVILSLLTDILAPTFKDQEQTFKSASILLENLEPKLACKLLSAGGKEYLKIIFDAQNLYDLAQVDRIHNAMISLYSSQNIIGYTGKIGASPTIYYHNKLDSTWGHITQHHDFPENIGRDIPIKDPDFMAENITMLDGTVRYREKSQKCGYNHLSRGTFTPLNFMSTDTDDFKSLEADARTRFMIKPYYGNMFFMGLEQYVKISCE